MTRPDPPYLLNTDDGHPALEQLRLYHEEVLPQEARHRVEKHLLQCELCTDVLAGMAAANRAQTRAAVTDINQRIRNRAQRRQPTRTPYIPFMRLAAALLVLLISVVIFRYWQRPAIVPTSDKTVASQAQTNPEPLATISAPPDPVLKSAEPALPPTPAKNQRVKAQSAAEFNPKMPTVASASPAAEDPFAVDTAVVLESFSKRSDPAVFAMPVDSTADFKSLTRAKVAAAPTAARRLEMKTQDNLTFIGQTVGGKVLDASSNQGLPGVTVLVKGTAQRVTTDEEGNFSLIIPPGRNELVFSFIGYATLERKIKPTDDLLAVQLIPDASQLNEVVVSALGKKVSAPVKTIPAQPEIGQKAFQQYIRQNLRDPITDRLPKRQGRVEVGFTVTANGELTDFKIFKSLSPACDAEAIRVIKEGPAWQPRLLESKNSRYPEPENVRVIVQFTKK